MDINSTTQLFCPFLSLSQILSNLHVGAIAAPSNTNQDHLHYSIFASNAFNLTNHSYP